MVRTAITREHCEALAAAANYRVSGVAALCGLSVRQLQRDFRRHLGCSPLAWLSALKIRAARERLLAGEPVKIVALDLGFKQVSYFCEWFKAENGMTATEFVLAHAGTNAVVAKA